MSGGALVAGYLADRVFGDPAGYHPVAGFGALARRLELAAYAPTRPRGTTYAALLVCVAAAVGELAAGGRRRAPVLAIVTWASLGGRSLTDVADRLADQLQAGDLDGARATLPGLCGRDPDALDADALARAGLESVAENTTDAVVGALFWGAVAGPAGIVGYRAANTLDAMVGYRSPRYEEFGWAAARLDDLLNWPAAWLACVLTAVCAPVVGGTPRRTWRTMRRDGAKHPSLNAGRIEAAFAGALDVRLGGPVSYGGAPELRPTLGDGGAPTAGDLRRAARLSGAVSGLACAILAAARHAAGPR